MYICLCYGVTDKDIDKAFDSGLTSVEKIKKNLKVATNCGKCIDELSNIIELKSQNNGINHDTIEGVNIYIP